jgi:hypothetical protein
LGKGLTTPDCKNPANYKRIGWILLNNIGNAKWILDLYGWMIGALRFNSWQGLGIFLFTTASRTALEPTQPPIQWAPGALSLGHEADHSPPLSAKVKE